MSTNFILKNLCKQSYVLNGIKIGTNKKGNDRSNGLLANTLPKYCKNMNRSNNLSCRRQKASVIYLEEYLLAWFNQYRGERLKKF